MMGKGVVLRWWGIICGVLRTCGPGRAGRWIYAQGNSGRIIRICRTCVGGWCGGVGASGYRGDRQEIRSDRIVPRASGTSFSRSGSRYCRRRNSCRRCTGWVLFTREMAALGLGLGLGLRLRVACWGSRKLGVVYTISATTARND